jgi:hypothetical protein
MTLRFLKNEQLDAAMIKITNLMTDTNLKGIDDSLKQDFHQSVDQCIANTQALMNR